MMTYDIDVDVERISALKSHIKFLTMCIWDTDDRELENIFYNVIKDRKREIDKIMKRMSLSVK